MRSRLFSIIQPVLAVLLGLLIGLVVTFLAGESPWTVMSILAKSAFGSWYDFGMTLFYATPLVLTGLSVAVAFRAGLFNIGAEGQLEFGALAAALVGILLPSLSSPFALLLAVLAAFAGGALWGLIPGWLRAVRGSHEVITTIMLNFVASGLTSWVTLYVVPNSESQNPETRAVGPGFLLSHLKLFDGAPVTWAVLLSLVVAGIVAFVLARTRFGFDLRAVGRNESAALTAGINSKAVYILAMVLAGGIAGLIGVGEVLGNAGRFKMGFSPGYGFVGIAVALLGRTKPIGVVFAALLFGALHKGTADLDFETEHVTRDLALILQAIIILSVASDGLWTWLKRRERSG